MAIMNKGTLIILNGGSSAGKTTLGKAMQDAMEECYLLLGIDAFWFTLPRASSILIGLSRTTTRGR